MAGDGRRGDGGQTDLNNVRVAKDHAMIEALGALDETGAALGLAAALLEQDGLIEQAGVIRKVQADLLDIGACLLGLKDCDWSERTLRLEQQIEQRSPGNMPEVFVLQGQTPAGAALHLARTAARRAERRCVSALRQSGREVRLGYLNRLSELLYVMALRAET